MRADLSAPDAAYAEALEAAVTLLGAPDVARRILGGDVHASVLTDPAVRHALARLVLRDHELRDRLLRIIGETLAAASLAFDAVSTLGAAPAASGSEAVRDRLLHWLGEITAIRSALDDVAGSPDSRIDSLLT
ncbi:MAG TPA: hypothetical protein VF102_01365 [Gemmatimonadaceae bacterium]